jgi:hypothetical protein
MDLARIALSAAKFMLAPRRLLRKLSMTPRLGDDAVL